MHCMVSLKVFWFPASTVWKWAKQSSTATEAAGLAYFSIHQTNRAYKSTGFHPSSCRPSTLHSLKPDNSCGVFQTVCCEARLQAATPRHNPEVTSHVIIIGLRSRQSTETSGARKTIRTHASYLHERWKNWISFSERIFTNVTWYAPHIWWKRRR